MQTEKKTFTKAEAEVVRFEKTDVIATSPMVIGPIGGEGFIDDDEDDN